jgi:DMSO/TMAO reductase YedYZ molybdopterin-dependent catalytic subunit
LGSQIMATQRSLVIAAVAGSLMLAGGASSRAAEVTSRFSVTGAVNQPRTFTRPDLLALPQSTEQVTYLSGSKTVQSTFQGPTLWTVLEASGLAAPPGVKNPTLRDVVVATGSDGYAVAFSGGELDPRFGGARAPDLVGVVEDGQPLGSDGFARTVVPGDARGGRYVSNLTNLNVIQAPSNPSQGAQPSTSFTVSGLVQHPTTYDRASLSALPSATEQVSYTSAGQPVTASFTGVPLWTLLLAAGLVTDPAIKNDELRDYVLATGSDGYEATFSLGELDPRFGGGSGLTDLVAFDENGSPLGSDGFARLVVPGDAAGGRYVSNLVSLQVLSATIPTPVPLPRSLPLLAGSLALVALLRPRRRSGA